METNFLLLEVNGGFLGPTYFFKISNLGLPEPYTGSNTDFATVSIPAAKGQN